MVIHKIIKITTGIIYNKRELIIKISSFFLFYKFNELKK